MEHTNPTSGSSSPVKDATVPLESPSERPALSEDDQIIMNADLLITRASERRRVLFLANRIDLPYNLKLLLKCNPQIEEQDADEYFEKMAEMRRQSDRDRGPSEEEVSSQKKHQTFLESVNRLCETSSKLNQSLLDELEELKRGDYNEYHDGQRSSINTADNGTS